MYTLYNSQFTITRAESSHCVFTGSLSSNTVGSVHLPDCQLNSSLTDSQSQSYFMTDDQSVSKSWFQGQASKQ
jgi:hypothetical protein